MLVLGNLLWVLGEALQSILWVYSIVLFARAVVSWVNADPRHPAIQLLVTLTDPLLRAIRHMLPTNLRYFPIDVAFLVLLAIVIFSQYAIAQTLIDVGLRLRRPVGIEPV
jgi:YggT family protein